MQRENEDLKATIAALQEQLEAANPLSSDERATLRKMTAGELRRLQRELDTTEQALLNQDKGRSPSTEEGIAKREQRKAKLADAIAQLKDTIAQLEEIGQKLRAT